MVILGGVLTTAIDFFNVANDAAAPMPLRSAGFLSSSTNPNALVFRNYGRGKVMANDDQAARDSKAEKLREQISRLKNQDKAGAEKDPSRSEAPPTRSPRDFVNERMRELDEEEQRSAKSSCRQAVSDG